MTTTKLHRYYVLNAQSHRVDVTKLRPKYMRNHVGAITGSCQHCAQCGLRVKPLCEKIEKKMQLNGTKKTFAEVNREQNYLVKSSEKKKTYKELGNTQLVHVLLHLCLLAALLEEAGSRHRWRACVHVVAHLAPEEGRTQVVLLQRCSQHEALKFVMFLTFFFAPHTIQLGREEGGHTPNPCDPLQNNVLVIGSSAATRRSISANHSQTKRSFSICDYVYPLINFVRTNNTAPKNRREEDVWKVLGLQYV